MSQGLLLHELKIILASSSPRRKELLQEIGIPFEAVHSNIDESVAPTRKDSPKCDPWQIPLDLSMLKALSAAKDYPERLVFAADTIVYVEGQILGKPIDRDEGRRFLKLLSGRKHQVVTGISWVHKSKKYSFSDFSLTHVYVQPLSDRDIEDYLESEVGMDAAGAYKIQSMFFKYIKKLDGFYHNVVGLPVGLVYQSYCRYCGLYK